MADNGVDELFVDTRLPQDLLLLCAVLLRPLLKIEVVEDPDGLPKVRLIAVAEFYRIPAQDIADDAPVPSVKFPFVILAQQCPSFLGCRYH